MEAALSPLADGAGYELAFYGGSFTAIPTRQQEELLGAAAPHLRRGAVAALRVSTRPDAVDDAALERLQKYGVETVELGAQSMDDEVLRLSGRGHTAEDTRRAAALVKAHGLALVLQMMTGLPGSDDDKDVATARALIDLGPDAVRIYPTVVIRDTALEEMWRAGTYAEHTVEDAVRVCSVILPMFERAGIGVIRLGLNPTQELSTGSAAAGAYHPALGELVRSRILRQRAEELLMGAAPGSDVLLHVPAGRLSQMIGQKRENTLWLLQRFGLRSLRVIPSREEELRAEIKE